MLHTSLTAVLVTISGLSALFTGCGPVEEAGPSPEEHTNSPCVEPEEHVPVTAMDACTALDASIDAETVFPEFEEVPGEWPPFEGGVIRPGTYVLTKILVADPSVPIEPGARATHRETIAFGGGGWHFNDEFEGEDSRVGGSYTVGENEPELFFEAVCGADLLSALPFPFVWGFLPNGYTATCDTITIDVEVSPLSCANCGTARRVFTRIR